MKVGTDGVLLGAWCRVESGQDEVILDIGAGTGVIALQLAQRTEGSGALVEAIEIDPAACAAARRNFEVSEWAERLVLHAMSVQEFVGRVSASTIESSASPHVTPAPSVPDASYVHSAPPLVSFMARKYDHIVSNPPWFVDSLLSPDASRTTARHTGSLSYEDLMSVCDRVLKPDGRVSLILPAGAETREMIATATTAGFVVSRRTDVFSTPASGPKRTLLELVRRTSDTLHATPAATTLVIQDAGPNSFSAEYRALTADFYLYF